MAHLLKAAVLAATVAAGYATDIAEIRAAQLNSTLREVQGVTTELGANASAITYWVNETDGWHVVTTVDVLIGKGGGSENHAVVRFSSVPLPGQSQTISIPLPIGERQQAPRFRRLRNRLEIQRMTGSV